MECKNNIRICPNGWSDCNLCKFDAQCNAGTYVPEPEQSDIEVVIKAAEISKKVIDAEAKKNVESIRGNNWREEGWHEHFMSLSPDQVMDELYKYDKPGLHCVEPWQAMAGPSEPGGATMKTKKDTKGHKPTIYEWGCFK